MLRVTMTRRLGSIVVMGILGGCASAPPCPEASVPAPAPVTRASAEPTAVKSEAATVVVFVRHAEKADDGTPDPPLTERGQRRAACLAALLEGFEPDHLLTSQYQRTRATLEPLAAARGVAPEVVEASDDQAWAAVLHELPPGSRAVVAGHSNTLPAWVAELGGEVQGLDDQGNIPHDDYDRMITVIVDGGGRFVTSYTTGYCMEPVG